MRKKSLALLTGALLAVIPVGVAGSSASATDSAKQPQARAHDDRPSPLSDKQRELRKEALAKQAKGQIPRGAKVGKVAKGQYVQLTRESEDSIWTLLGQFSDLAHNQIPEPDRSADNTTIWEPDFSRSYYLDLLFDDKAGENSMRNYYKEQSSNRYAVNGDVTDWVQVPQAGAYYGSNAKSDAYAWIFIRDELKAWYDQQSAAGKSDADIATYLSQFDKWDRYDYDGDGNFNEPDGYIDHFQTIHSGEGEEAGGGVLGEDAIWSHRWYAFYMNEGTTGPSFNKLGGIQIPGTDLWIGDYTIEPENGGVGVFAHEFAHDLGLPDEYDTSGNVGGAENSTGFWTLMSSGSWGNNGKADEGIGDRPFHMDVWDKFQLGWLNYEAVRPGDKAKSVKLGPAETNTKQAQAAIVVLPDREHKVEIGKPYAGSKYYYSGAANSLDTTMTKSFTGLPTGATLTAKVRYSIESGYDYAYVSVDGAKVATNLSTAADVPGGIDGHSDGWVDLTADLPAGDHTVGFGYFTDGGVQGDGDGSAPGIGIDDIAITGQAVDGAESDTGWAFTSNQKGTGFGVTSGTEVFKTFNFYVAGNRQYLGYDANLATGPYNFLGGDLAERFAYQDGLLVWYSDYFWGDNNVGDHPGEGLILPVDARPDILHWKDDGTIMRGRFQPFDATFGTPADSITLHHNGVATTIPAQKAVMVFDDNKSYYRASDPADAKSHYQAGWFSVNNPHTGTQIRVTSVTPGGFMQVQVTPPPVR